MQCRQCKFENMPGLDRCFQCGAVLKDEVAVDVHPPRMPGWQAPLRNVGRWVRTRRAGGAGREQAPETEARTDAYMEGAEIVLVAVLSIVPGFGHIVRRQFDRVWWQVLLWMVLAGMAIYAYGSAYGYLMFGLAAGLHARIAVHWPDEEELRGFKRLGVMIAMFIVAAVAYRVVFHAVVDGRLIWARTPIAVEGRNIQAGDMLLARRRFDPQDVRPGNLLVVDLPRLLVGQAHGGPFVQTGVVVQVIGTAGDTVEVHGNSFSLNGSELDIAQYAYPAWLQGREMSTVVPMGRLFISAEYQVRGNVEFDNRIALQACLIDESNVKGIVFMRWLPFSRRGYLAE